MDLRSAPSGASHFSALSTASLAPATVEAAQVAGRAWAEGTAVHETPRGPWPGGERDVRLMYPEMQTDLVPALLQAAEDRWRELWVAQAKRDADAARQRQEAAERVLAHMDTLLRGTVGVCGVQVPIVAGGIEATHGALLAAVELRAGVWVASVPACGVEARGYTLKESVRKLHDAVVEAFAADRAKPSDAPEAKALRALVRPAAKRGR